MRVLISGIAGSLGSNIADRLLARGNEIVGIDNFATGSADAISEHRGLRFIEGSIADAELLKTLFDSFKPEVVVHSAASYKDPDDWREDIATNVQGTANMVRASLATGVKRFINFQTALCYGRPQERPVDLSHPLMPFTSYGISKAAGELYLMSSGLPYVSLRMASVYGPRHYVGPIPTFYKRLKAGQKCFVTDTRRDYVAMLDFLDLFDRIIAEGAPTGVYHLSTGADISIKEIFDAVAEGIGLKLDVPVEVRPPAPDDVSSIRLDPSQTEKDFGWAPKIPFREGLQELIAWYDTYGVEQTFSHLRGNR